MKAYSLIITIIVCCTYRYASIEIKPDLKKKHFKIWLWFEL